MRRESAWKRAKNRIEHYLPMTINSLVLFAIVGYLAYIVGQSVYANYQSNKSIEAEQQKITDLKTSISQLENEIAYYRTDSYRERQARAKLGYKAPGENVISLNFDQPEEKIADSGKSESIIKTPNYRLWWQYFTRS
jgi:cell division protein FtsB